MWGFGGAPEDTLTSSLGSKIGFSFTLYSTIDQYDHIKVWLQKFVFSETYITVTVSIQAKVSSKNQENHTNNRRMSCYKLTITQCKET